MKTGTQRYHKDEDIIPLDLVKGSNQLLLKVQDMQGGWGFVARLPDSRLQIVGCGYTYR